MFVLKYNLKWVYKCKIWDYKSVDFDRLNFLIKDSNWLIFIFEVSNVFVVVENFIIYFFKCVCECILEKIIIV